MKKSLIFLASVGLLFVAGCGNTSEGKDSFNKDTSPTTEAISKISFEKESYTINPKDKITVKGNVSGVTYAFQGGAPEGVTLNSTTGEIDFDAFGNPIPEKVYIATFNGQTATTIVKFNMQQEKPVLTFMNNSEYLVDGDVVLCTAKTDKGREYAVSYSLKVAIDGITINKETGRVSFSDKVSDGTSFTVVAESQGETSEKRFIAMKNNIIFSDGDVILEKGSSESATFVLNFNGNSDAESETTAEDVKLLVDNMIVEVNGFSYDKETKTITIPASYLATLSTGEHNFKVTTKRNNVPLSLAIADKIIYQAKDFETIFEPNYTEAVPSFKENSLNGYYALGSDIDLASFIKEKGDWAPIGAYLEDENGYDIPFTGTFNGNGYTISGFSYRGMTAVKTVNGFFGRVTGTIKNFTLKGAIEIAKSWSGAIVGNNKGTMENIIADISMVNEGQNATGVLCSVNHGLIQNCLSINENVTGNLNPDLSWRQSGLAVGLNETDGTIKNVYALGEGQIFGYSQNTNVTMESCGKVFATLDEMKAFDFASLPSHYFKKEEGKLPTLKTLSIPHTPGYFAFSALPKYGLKGDSVPLSMLIKPEERQEEYNNFVTYSIEGESYGAKIVDKSISLTDINVPEGGATLSVKASLKLDQYGIDMTASASLLLYNAIGGLTIANTEKAIGAGDTLELKTATTPSSAIEATFMATTAPAWKSCYFTLKGNKLHVKDDCPEGLEITVEASAIGETVSKTFIVKKLNTFLGNNAIHYQNDNSDFSYEIAGIGDAIKEVTLDGTVVASSEYSLTQGVFSLKSTAFTEKDVQHVLKVTDNNDKIYRAFATTTSEEKVDEAWLNNCFGADGYTKISSMEDFNQYFAVDATTHAELAGNFGRSKVYALTADLDFTGIAFNSIGKNLNGEEKHAIFNGQFYGLGHTIKNVNINTDNHSWNDAFFFKIGGDEVKAVVKDINFVDCNITKAGGNYSGILSAFVGNSAVIRNINAYNCSVVAGDNTHFNNGGMAIGGLIGNTWSKDIKYCTFNGYNINMVGQTN